MVDNSAFHCLSYGLYIVSTKHEGSHAACVVNTFQQVTSTPLQVAVTLNKDNATTGLLLKSGRFAVTCFSQEATMDLIGTFGFHCSNDRDKFQNFETSYDMNGLPYVPSQAVARFSAHVVQTLDLGTHILFVGEVDEAEKLCSDEPMTYAYYHAVKGGKTPPKASSYLGEEIPSSTEDKDEKSLSPRFAWRCVVCGHIEYINELPDDFTCPLCGVGKEMFERIEI